MTFFFVAGKFKKKTVKKAVFGHLLKNFGKKIAFFFGARSPSKLLYIGAKGAFRKNLGSVGQKWFSEKVSKGGPFGSAGGRIPFFSKFQLQSLFKKLFIFPVSINSLTFLELIVKLPLNPIYMSHFI